MNWFLSCTLSFTHMQSFRKFVGQVSKIGSMNVQIGLVVKCSLHVETFGGPFPRTKGKFGGNVSTNNPNHPDVDGSGYIESVVFLRFSVMGMGWLVGILMVDLKCVGLWFYELFLSITWLQPLQIRVKRPQRPTTTPITPIYISRGVIIDYLQ